MAVVLAHAGIVVSLVAPPTLACRARVGGELELCGWQVLVAAWTEVDVLAQCGRVLGNLKWADRYRKRHYEGHVKVGVRSHSRAGHNLWNSYSIVAEVV